MLFYSRGKASFIPQETKWMEIAVFLDLGTLFHKEIKHCCCLITKPSACEAFVLFHFDLTHKCGKKQFGNILGT